MGSVVSTIASGWGSVPPLTDFFPPTPEAYSSLLSMFQYFPVITISQWLSSFHPAGKTSLASSRLNLPGPIAWSIMEIVGPINLLYVLWRLPPMLDTNMSIASLTTWNKLVASLYVVHYVNRAIISPLFASPSMSPIHASIVLSAALFNWFNSSCLAAWLVGYETPVLGYKTDGGAPASSSALSSLSIAQQVLPYAGLALFAIGMAGNISAERTLYRLRREEADRRFIAIANEKRKQEETKRPSGADLPPETTVQETRDRYTKVYVVPPPRGLYRAMLYPHYVFEWLEWFGFALAGTAVFPGRKLSTSGSGSYATATPPIRRLAPWLVPAAWAAERLRVPLPLPAVVFCANAVANMLPHARWGRKWYVDKFGEKAVAGRGAVVPWFKWL